MEKISSSQVSTATYDQVQVAVLVS